MFKALLGVLGFKRNVKEEPNHRAVFAQVGGFVPLTDSEMETSAGQYAGRNKFPVYEDEDGKWKVMLEMCSLQGCPIKEEEFDTEDQANAHALKLSAQGLKLDLSCACHPCYVEYHREMIGV